MSGAPCPKVPRPPKVQRGSQRTPMKRKSKKRDNEFSPTVRKQAEARAGGECEAHTPDCDRSMLVHHHKHRRGQGGPGTLENDLVCCNSCHLYIHANVRESFERGWLIRPAAAA